MPTRTETIKIAIEKMEKSLWPNQLTIENSWLGIYQTLLESVPVKYEGLTAVPHIIDADKLRLDRGGKIWLNRAVKVNEYLALQMNVKNEEVKKSLDRLMRGAPFRGKQRHNTIGIAFGGLIKHCLDTLGSPKYKTRTEAPATELFPGITLQGRSVKPYVDVLIEKENMPIAILSCKWSLRHDRLSDIINECPIYKGAFNRMHRPLKLKFFVLTNEFDPARLQKLIDDDGIDGVVHVHKPAVIDVCGLNGRLKRMMDLPDLIREFS